jgi:hypothetical protein
MVDHFRKFVHIVDYVNDVVRIKTCKTSIETQQIIITRLPQFRARRRTGQRNLVSGRFSFPHNRCQCCGDTVLDLGSGACFNASLFLRGVFHRQSVVATALLLYVRLPRQMLSMFSIRAFSSLLDVMLLFLLHKKQKT